MKVNWNYWERDHFPVIDTLHTDILSKKYWKIIAKVIVHDNVSSERMRIARLVDKDNVLRTYALTFLTYDKSNEEIFLIDEEIKRWWLIWETFRKNHYVIKKNIIDVFIIDLPIWMAEDFHVDWKKAKARLTEFYTKSNLTAPVVYWIVLEIYSPDFKNPEDWINEVDVSQINPTTWTLQDSWISMDKIRENLDKASTSNNEWDAELKEKYEQAKTMSKSILDVLHQKIKKYLDLL